MDAGVPMKKPVSGIAMGLIKNPGEEKYAVLSDILGDEDHLGDMDFKTTGTKDGLTATQMDIKCDGLSFDILEKALMQAKAGREYILGKLTETIAEPRAELKPQVPRIEAFDIPKEFIGAVTFSSFQSHMDFMNQCSSVAPKFSTLPRVCDTRHAAAPPPPGS